MSDDTRRAAEAAGEDGSGPDRLLDHEYDGIREYDNPMPGWWVYLFYATILFSALYLINIPGMGPGKGRIASYEAEMEAARARFGTRQAAVSLSDDQILALARDPARLEAGRAAYSTNCAACHRADGGGVIGPNLTDEFWIHGARPTQILATVSNGVLDKGMPAWGTVLKPEQLEAVVAYAISLHGTDPPEPKAPQGDRVEAGAPEGAGTGAH